MSEDELARLKFSHRFWFCASCLEALGIGVVVCLYLGAVRDYGRLVDKYSQSSDLIVEQGNKIRVQAKVNDELMAEAHRKHQQIQDQHDLIVRQDSTNTKLCESLEKTQQLLERALNKKQ